MVNGNENAAQVNNWQFWRLEGLNALDLLAQRELQVNQGHKLAIIGRQSMLGIRVLNKKAAKKQILKESQQE